MKRQARAHWRWMSLTGWLLALVMWARPASAQTPRDSASAQVTAEREEPSQASPRVAVEAYLRLARAGRFPEAARYLDLGDSLATQGAVLARRLKAVLDRHAWIDLDEVSGIAIGDTADGLPATVDQIAAIPVEGTRSEPVRMARAVVERDPQWRFTRSTVLRIDGWYESLPDQWVLEHLPQPLLRPGPLELLWWQWLTIPLLVGVAAVVGYLASRGLLALVVRAVRRTRSGWDDALLDRLGGPLTLTGSLVAAWFLLPWLGLYPPAAAGAGRVIRAGFFIVLFWALWRLVDIARDLASRSRWAAAGPSARALLPLASRTAKVIVLAIGGIAVLSLLGYPVASLVAGLGLGGLALALAAQKTVENLFGAFSLGVDQPFREGDFVKVEDFVGTVEAMGLRSTRFRTLDRTLITIPNGRLADMRLESFAARDRLRFATVIGLVYETSRAQMTTALAGFEQVLRAHPRIWPDAVVVRFREFAPSSLDIEVMAWFQTSDWGEFQAIRQEILLDFMRVVESAGTSFAFPTQTIHVATPAP